MARASTTSTNSNNWLSFSLSPMEMPQFVQYDAASSVTNSSHQNHHHYFLDNMYTNGWGNGNSKSEAEAQEQSIWFMDSSNGQSLNHHAPPPKLEDFLGDSQTETQDSSLTHMYDHQQHHHHGSTYFGGDHHHQHQHQSQHHQQHQDLKSITGFQAFSNNSGSEVDDSGSIGKSQAACNDFGTHCVESGNEFAYSTATATASGALSLGVAQSSEENAIVVADSDSSKKIVDTFGQRTSIYRGVTRHRWTGRYEAHLWDNSCRREGQARKGRQGDL